MAVASQEPVRPWWQNVIRKYFLVPQALNAKPPPLLRGSFIEKHRKLLSIAIPIVVVHTLWWYYMSVNNLFYLFNGDIGAYDKPRHLLSVTMIFGSMIAGATSEGGAAVAFPVLTLVMGVAPPIARDFGFMIQAVGMSAASFSIFFMNVKLEYRSLLYCTLGGTLGVIYGLEYVAPRLSPPFTKMYFVCIWFSFALALYWLNFYHDRKVYESIPYWNTGRLLTEYSLDLTPMYRWLVAAACPTTASGPDSPEAEPGTNANDTEAAVEQVGTAETASETLEEDAPLVSLHWKALVLFVGGFLGGVFSSMGGSGLDICSFSILTLLFCVSERVATPTSIVLMAVNSIVAFMWRDLHSHAIDPESWRMWLCCVPIVCIGAPLGAMLSSHWHRLVIAFLVVAIDIAQLAGALYVVQPWSTSHTDYPLALCLNSGLLMLGSAVGFSLLAFGGSKMLESYSRLPLELQHREERLHAETFKPEELNKDAAGDVELAGAGTLFKDAAAVSVAGDNSDL